MKIITYEKSKDIISSLKKEGKTTIFKSGCFDTLHIGHVKMLQNAKSMADILIVGIGTDSNILEYKRKPIFDQDNRMEVMAALQCVDYVVLLQEPMVNNIDHKEFLTLTYPDFYYLPYDDKVLKDKKKMAKQLGIKVICESNIEIKNYSNVIEPHSSDIINTKKLHFNIEELYSKDFELLRTQGLLIDEWRNVYDHCKMEGIIAMILTVMLELSEKDSDILIRAAILHDWYKRKERESQDYNVDYSKVELKKLGIKPTIIQVAHSVGHTSLKKIENST